VGQELSKDGRARVRHHVEAPPAAVWGVLADGWQYANWVVGASRVRWVDLTWPQAGASLKHSFGVWPVVLNDESRVLESEPDRRIVIQAKGWPLGEARVELTIEATDPSQADTCEVSIVEDAVTGPGVLVPRVVRQPLIAVRNREALRRLALIAEGHHREWTQRASG
jgi:carbon monoxide dehydrogenase subunit G